MTDVSPPETPHTPKSGCTIESFRASDGYRLHYRRWHVAGGSSPRGVVVALHGIQSHSGWYEYSSRRLAENGYEVLFLDRRGSGLNEAARGHAPAAERLIHDVTQFLQHVRRCGEQEGRRSPVILLGLSWSGKLAAVVAALRPELINGLALLYPGLLARVRPSLLQRVLLGLAGLAGIRNRRVRIPLDDPALFTDDSQWRDFIARDPLALRQVSVGFLLANRELDRRARQIAKQIHVPVLLLLAGRDRIIDNAATRRYFAQLAVPSRTLIEYPEARHTLEFEPNRDAVIDDLCAWLNDLSGKVVLATPTLYTESQHR